MSESEDNQIEKIKAWANWAMGAWSKQRRREMEDLQFQDPRLQWDEAARLAREGGLFGGQALPPRPMISINKLKQPVQMVLNQMRAAHLGVNLHPLTEGADEDTAEVLQDVYREIERRSNAPAVRAWGFARGIMCGLGYYRAVVEYDLDSPEKDDLCITLERILDQSSVYLDPAAQRSDFSDGMCALITTWLTEDQFRLQFPGSSIPEVSQQDFISDEQTTPPWVRMEGSKRDILVAEYWYKEPQGEDEFPKVMVCKLTSAGFIKGEEPREWLDVFIPIFPCIGEELQPFDNDRRWEGIIRPARDSQKMYNWAASTAMEVGGMEPKAPWIGPEGTFEGHMQEFQNSNILNLPVLQYKPVVLEGGQLAPPPQRVQIDSSRLGVAMTLLQSADNFIQSTSVQFDPSLGRENSKERSGRAIEALQGQTEQANSGYIGNLADITMTYEGKVIVSLMSKVYNRVGRVIRTLSSQNKPGAVMVGVPYKNDPRTGIPQQVPRGTPGAKHVDFTKGRYGVSITVGKSFQSRRQAGFDKIGELIQSQPQLFPILGDMWATFSDIPEREEIAERIKKLQPPQLQVPKDGEEATPQQLQFQLQQMKQENDGLKQQLQGAAEAIKTDQVKSQATLQKTEMDNQTKLQLAQMQGQIDILMTQLKLTAENRRTGAELVHESEEASRDRAHDVGMQGQARVHAVEDSATPTLKPLDLNYSGSAETDLPGVERY